VPIWACCTAMVTVREASVETIALVFPSLISHPESLCKPFIYESAAAVKRKIKPNRR